MAETQPERSSPGAPGLVREVGLLEATALNMIDMIGVGPFITIPLIIHAMHGPQAMLGWVLGALLAMCDGLVWADLIPLCLAAAVQRAAFHRFRMSPYPAQKRRPRQSRLPGRHGWRGRDAP